MLLQGVVGVRNGRCGGCCGGMRPYKQFQRLSPQSDNNH